MYVWVFFGLLSRPWTIAGWRQVKEGRRRRRSKEKKRRKRDRDKNGPKGKKVSWMSRNTSSLSSQVRQVPIWYEDIYSIQFDNNNNKKTRRIPRPRTSLRPSLPFFPFTYICGWHQQGETFSLPLPSHDDNGGRRRRQTVWPKAKKRGE